MAAPIQVDFVVGGVKTVLQSFASITSAQKQMERSVAISVAGESRARESGAKNSEKAMQAYANKQQKLLDKSVRDAERAATADSKIQERRFNAITKRLDKEVQDVEKAEQAKYRARELQEKRSLDIQLQSAKMAGRIADEHVREINAKRKSIASGVAGQVVSSARGALGGVASIAGGVLALGGGFSIADGVQSSIRNSGKAKQLELNSNGEVSKGQVLSTAKDVGNSMGISSEGVIDALDAFVAKSGDVKAGLSSIRDMAELAAATGADLKDLATVAGQAQTGTKDINVTMDMMREVAGMGRKGSVDVRELAQYGSRIFAGASKFENVRGAATTIGAMVQSAAAGSGGATGAAEASEAAPHLASDMYKNEEGFKALGIDIRSKKNRNTLADLKGTVIQTLQKTGGDFAQLQGLFGERSVKGVAGAANAYVRAGQGLTGKDQVAAKTAAALAVFDEFEKAALKEKQVKEEAQARIQEADRQLEIVFNRLRESVGEQLVPELLKLIPKVSAMIPAFTRLLEKSVAFAEWFANNPLAGIGLVVMGAITKDLAAAGIGAAVKLILTETIMGAMAGGAGGGGAAGAAGGGAKAFLAAGGGAGPLALIGAGAAYQESTQIDAALSGQTGGQRTVGELLADASDPKKATAVRKRLAEAKAGTGIGGTLGAIQSFGNAAAGEAYSAVSGKANPFTKEVSEYETNRQINAAADTIAKAITKAADEAKSGKSPPPQANGSRSTPMTGPAR